MALCKGCVHGKHHRLPLPTNGAKRATDILELVHSDVCGPMKQESFGGARYFLTFIDDKTRKTFVYFLKSKNEVFKKFQEFKVFAENQIGKRIKALRSDNGGEYISHAFDKYLKSNGIRHQTTIAYTPEQNGVAERANRTIVERARSMLHARDMKHEFWAEAVATAVYLKNRSPTKAVSDMTPEEAWSGSRPSVTHLRSFGCKAYAHVPKQKRTKLDSKTTECIFIGYSDDSKAYRLFNPVTKAVIKSRDVIFDELSNARTRENKSITTDSEVFITSEDHKQVPSQSQPRT
jgi:transposase InsO family protein